MATEINRNTSITRWVRSEESFLDRHFAKIAFAISSVALFCLSPLTFLMGSLIGFVFHFSLEPNLSLSREDKIVTIPHTILAIVGAFAALVQVLPAGATGGLVFKSIAPLCSLSLGSVAYRGFKSFQIEGISD